MKIIILESTLSLICESQENVIKLLNEGYKIKQIKNFKYLVKDEIL